VLSDILDNCDGFRDLPCLCRNISALFVLLAQQPSRQRPFKYVSKMNAASHIPPGCSESFQVRPGLLLNQVRATAYIGKCPRVFAATCVTLSCRISCLPASCSSARYTEDRHGLMTKPSWFGSACACGGRTRFERDCRPVTICHNWRAGDTRRLSTERDHALKATCEAVTRSSYPNAPCQRTIMREAPRRQPFPLRVDSLERADCSRRH
jgi:hypothetical protein